METVLIVVWVAACVLSGVAWMRSRARLTHRLRSGMELSDEDVREIIDTGIFAGSEDDEPLDLTRVEEEERRFWEEEWDQAEEW